MLKGGDYYQVDWYVMLRCRLSNRISLSVSLSEIRLSFTNPAKNGRSGMGAFLDCESAGDVQLYVRSKYIRTLFALYSFLANCHRDATRMLRTKVPIMNDMLTLHRQLDSFIYRFFVISFTSTESFSRPSPNHARTVLYK